MAAVRIVLIVNIDSGSDSRTLFNAMYGRFVDKLKNTPELSVSTVDSVKTLQSKCTRCVPKNTVLLFTNEIISKRKDLHEMVTQFVNGGGLALFGCLFSTFVKPPLMDAMFNAFGLPWKCSNHYRTTFGLTEVGKSLLTNVSERYSAKAVQLAEVLPQQNLYKPVEDATNESLAFSTEPADASLVMSALGKLGRGAIAYVGDSSTEEASDGVIVALCLAIW